MTLFEFFLALAIMLVIGPAIIAGWYAITRGRIEYTPDGKPFKTGKIFKAWHFFWNQHASSHLLVKGASLKQAVIKLHTAFPNIEITSIDTEKGFVDMDKSVHDFLSNRKYKVEEITGAQVYFGTDKSTSAMQLVKEHKIFRFSEYVRDPLSECPTCMASVYGSIIWWTVQGLSNFSMFEWSVLGVWTSLIFWVFYCIGCAYINTILSKKL